MKGFKGFDKNLCCRGFQYEVGKTYEMEEEPILCERGFHFCERLDQTIRYYPLFDYFQRFIGGRGLSFMTNNRYCEVVAVGVIRPRAYTSLGDKLVTNKIRIIRELSNEEIWSRLEFWLSYRYSPDEVRRIESYLNS